MAAAGEGFSFASEGNVWVQVFALGCRFPFVGVMFGLSRLRDMYSFLDYLYISE